MTHFVYPYIKDFAQGEELKHSIRSICKNYVGDFKIFIVGDSEEWMSDEINLIKIERVSDNPPLDIANKLKAVIGDERIDDNFVWMNDDIYLTNQVYIHDLQLFKSVGKLEETVNPSLGTIYQRNKLETLRYLKSNNLSSYDYSTHLPQYYNKKLMLELLNSLELHKKSMLISSLYFNIFFGDQIPFVLNHRIDNIKIGVYRANPDYEYLESCLKTKKFFNHSQTGFTKRVELLVKSLFKESCKFEKL